MRCIYSHKQKYKNSQSTDDFYVNSVNTLTIFIHNTTYHHETILGRNAYWNKQNIEYP